MEIEILLENLKQEEMKKLLPLFIKYFYQLDVKDYYYLCKEIKVILKKTL